MSEKKLTPAESEVGVRVAIDSYGHATVSAFRKKNLGLTGELAFRLIESWGMSTGTYEGETSSGTSKARLLTPREVVVRAFSIAEEAYRVAEEHGHLQSLPDLNELSVQYDIQLAERLLDRLKRVAAEIANRETQAELEKQDTR